MSWKDEHQTENDGQYWYRGDRTKCVVPKRIDGPQLIETRGTEQYELPVPDPDVKFVYKTVRINRWGEIWTYNRGRWTNYGFEAKRGFEDPRRGAVGEVKR